MSDNNPIAAHREQNRQRGARLWAREQAARVLAKRHPEEYDELVTEYTAEYLREVRR